MTSQRRAAILSGTKAAQRLHAQLGTRNAVESGAQSRVDVFRIVDQLGAVLLFRRLKGLLGAYFAEPVSSVPGIIISTERDLHVQRFTTAHEIGHLYLRHSPSFDENVGLWRSGGKDAHEVEADAFASEFLLPRWLYVYHCRRRRWTSTALREAENTYQLSLRLGASYDAVCWGLQSHSILPAQVVHRLRAVEPRRAKLAALAGRASLEDSWANVWVVTEADSGLRLEGTPNDVIVFRLSEHAAAGYLWDETQLRQQGLQVVADERWENSGEDCGGAISRVLVTRVSEPREYRLDLSEQRPWMRTDTAATVSLGFELYGKEEGLPRFARRALAGP